jgi:hypothetical protein
MLLWPKRILLYDGGELEYNETKLGYDTKNFRSNTTVSGESLNQS